MSAEQRDQIENLLWHVLSSENGEIPPSTKLLIVCSALDGLMKTIGGDMGSGKTRDEWMEAARITKLDWDGWLRPTMEIRKRYRDDLTHGRLWILEDSEPDTYFTDYPRLACAFMIMIAAFCGYRGVVVTHPFEGEVRRISSLMGCPV